MNQLNTVPVVNLNISCFFRISYDHFVHYWVFCTLSGCFPILAQILARASIRAVAKLLGPLSLVQIVLLYIERR